jgi:hypothetical protein
METFVIHPKDQAQQKALQTFLEGSNIPYENEPKPMKQNAYLLIPSWQKGLMRVLKILNRETLARLSWKICGNSLFS